jgi:hypothetical protein
MLAEAPAFEFLGSEAMAVGVAVAVLVLQWFLISFSAVRALDAATFSVLGALTNQMRRWIARSRRAAERMTSRKGRVAEFDEFLHACAAAEQKIDQLSHELSALRSETLAGFADTLHAIVFEFERLEIAFVEASRSVCPIVEQPGEALCETQKIRARIEATWRDYTDLCSQRQKAARRILMGRARDVLC